MPGPEDALIISGALSAGANVAGSAGNFLSQLFFGQRSEDWAREDAQMAFDRQRQLLDEQRFYESPAEQMKRYVEAGLNPSLIYGQPQGSISPPSVPQAHTASTPGSIPFTSGMLDPLLDARLKKAQIDQLESAGSLSRAEAYRIYQITPAEYDKIKNDADLIRQTITSNEYQTKLNQIKLSGIEDGKSYVHGMQYENADGSFTVEVTSYDIQQLIKDNEFYRLLSSKSDYDKAIQLFYTSIGLSKAQLTKINLENKDLEEFVKVCSKIYQSEASQAEYMATIADLNKQFYGKLGASNEIIKTVFALLNLLINGFSASKPSSVTYKTINNQ